MIQKTVLGIFTDRTDAEDAISKLEQVEYNPKEISIVMKDQQQGEKFAASTGTHIAEGATAGATTGAVIGGIAGLLVGIGAVAIPGVGALLIGGPLAAALGLTGAAATTISGATTGALAGGLLGALMGVGIPEQDAHVYEEQLKSGGILVAVPARLGEENDVKEILEDNGADTVRILQLHPLRRTEIRSEANENEDSAGDDPVISSHHYRR